MAANDPHHLIGDTVDNRDQLSSIVLMGLAIAGGLAAILVHAMLG